MLEEFQKGHICTVAVSILIRGAAVPPGVKQSVSGHSLGRCDGRNPGVSAPQRKTQRMDGMERRFPSGRWSYEVVQKVAKSDSSISKPSLGGGGETVEE